MKWFSTLLCLILYASSAFASDIEATGKPESVGLSTERLDRIDALLNRHVEDKKIAGAVALIARRGKIAYFRAFGVADNDKPMHKDTIFRIASMSKPLTSTAVMLLYQEGRLLLSDRISKYIPEFRHPKVLEILPQGSDSAFKLVPAKREITIRDLLCHTSGIVHLFGQNWFPDPKRKLLTDLYQEAGITDGMCRPDETIGELVKRLAKMPLYGQPGEVWEYGLSTDVLGYLVEIVSGMRLDEFMRLKITKPLMMNDTCFYLEKYKLPRLSAVWETDWNGKLTKMGQGPQQSGKLCLNPSDAHETSGRYISGGSGVLSTAYDYSRFCQMLLNNGELDGVRLLSRKTVELMTAANHIGELDAGFVHGRGWKFGLGFAIQTDRAYDENTRDEGVYEWAGVYSTRFSIDPKEQKITILMTQMSPFQYHYELWEKLLVLSASAIVD
jgi:CubicO group peptidase (beta-lactamase class C family)